ncbi:MAG: hypothetical protein JXB34_08445 [Bacteroidales bacterium]|nr:hypothetical protein [Bacteroidales bacterium]
MKHKNNFSFLLALAVLIIALTAISCDNNDILEEKSIIESQVAEGTLKAAVTHNQLAKRWAPVHQQDVDVTGSHGLNGKADYITAIDYDGDWNGTNNWNNLSRFPANAVVYYSVVETSTNWFILYAFFHPRDWTDNPIEYYWGEHENDLEGMLLSIKKDGTDYGSLQAAVTVAHSDFYSYVPAGSSVGANQESIDGTLSFEHYNGENHPVTAQEAKGHGLKAWPYYKINGDGVKYYPSFNDVAEAPSDAYDQFVPYKLIDIFAPGQMWQQRTNNNMFNADQKSFVKSVGYGGANTPWNWDDKDDTPGAGEIATNPARLINFYFSNLGNFSLSYTHNKYIGIN